MNRTEILQLWEAGHFSEGQAMEELGVSRIKARMLKEQALVSGQIRPAEAFEMSFTISKDGGAPETVMMTPGDVK